MLKTTGHPQIADQYNYVSVQQKMLNSLLITITMRTGAVTVKLAAAAAAAAAQFRSTTLMMILRKYLIKKNDHHMSDKCFQHDLDIKLGLREKSHMVAAMGSARPLSKTQSPDHQDLSHQALPARSWGTVHQVAAGFTTF